MPLPPPLFLMYMQDTMLLVQYRRECPMLVKYLLVHCKSHRDDVYTLFQLLESTQPGTSLPFISSPPALRTR